MNVGNFLLIKFLLTVSFGLNGAVACDNVVYGVLNHSVHLCASVPQGIPRNVYWKRGAKPLVRFKSHGGSNKTRAERNYLFPNGTLKIERLVEGDAANYTVQIFDEDGILKSENTITLHIVEQLPQLQLTYECLKKMLTCEVKYNKKPMPTFKLFQEKEEQKNIPKPKYVNNAWKVTHPLKNSLGKSRCEASISTNLQKAEIQLSCSGEIDMFLIMYIGAGVVVIVIFVALLVCCIRKKKTRRRELEDEERQLQAAKEALKYRKLPQPPIHAAPSEPHHQQRQPQPPPHAAVQQQPAPPLPRPRPQQKPPRRMKEKL
ncbi:T-cell surface antigen CD2 [Eublepharis macularius]|uniref:T-cell surface antigen CD2 n=1 Tax=Eublepharis macularius TaxID=481883 RepID=A0AA97J2U1_EUBMA|nr:T-cell surface antigen CD2 [Eublepharis macularius]